MLKIVLKNFRYFVMHCWRVYCDPASFYSYVEPESEKKNT